MGRLNNQEAVWVALSDLFLDTEISYEFIARRVAHVDVIALKYMLYFEVAPICIGNLLTPIPTIWSGFNEGCLISDIHHHLQRFNTSRFYRFKIKLTAKFYKRFLNHEWLKLTAEIRLVHERQLIS
ncbi:MAG: DUF7079 family protein [Psychrobacter sp.]|uniref:DUF7079 family protein n=1 Tax=Psychrobacter sp. AOP7-B1-24 TaxID=3457645 RepID=UPI003FB76031